MQAETISAAIRGEEPACRELFEQWYPKAYRIAKSICGGRDRAEDAVQEALIRFWGALPRLKDPETADRFFFKTVANEARRILSKRRKEPQGPAGGSAQGGGTGDKDFAEEREAAEALAQAVKELPEKLRCAVELFYYGGFTEAETAEILGVSLSCVKMRLLRARQMLRQTLERCGYEVAGG